MLTLRPSSPHRPEFEHYTFEDGQTSTESVGLTYREHVEYSAASPQQACAAKAKCDKSVPGRRSRDRRARVGRWQRQSLELFAQRLEAVMEERGGRSETVEMPDTHASDYENPFLQRARSLSVSAASSVAAFAAWCVTPDETDPEAMPPDRLSRSSSDSSVPSPGSRQSVSSDSIAVLGEALLRAREENSQSASSSQGIERVQSMFSPMGIA
mmetsp:Transcript_17422/g.40870  ORF Transcript_17422/g.40870 Transcript_17422/m.40870 type:complete len:212 (-) Transcript_17422:459-1094(-)